MSMAQIKAILEITKCALYICVIINTFPVTEADRFPHRYLVLVGFPTTVFDLVYCSCGDFYFMCYNNVT